MYKVGWRYKKSRKFKLIQKDLTLDQAKAMVQENQKTNPSIKVKMMVFEKM